MLRRFWVAYATNRAGKLVHYLLRDGDKPTAATCRFPLRPLPVKMRLERSAERDKREYIKYYFR